MRKLNNNTEDSNLYVKKISRNLKGKDYAVGDIHGCYSKLYEVLKKIRFDYEKDRLFCVGDLCDRGPESSGVINFLNNSWVHSTKGNHEQILFDYENGHINDEDMANVGASWWLSVSVENKSEILKRLAKLPLAIELETKTGKVGLLHGECPVADWNMLERSLKGILGFRFTNTLLWGAGSTTNTYPTKNIDAVIVGHMTQNSYKLVGNTHLLDTGAVYAGGFFTILDIETLTPVFYFN